MSAHDAGLRAVARVRGAREQDSRIGLQQAIAELRLREQVVLDRRRRLALVETPGQASVAEFVLHHDRVRAWVRSVDEARAEVDAAAALVASARAHWQVDKTRLSAVEMLLERRAEERRTERRRQEDRDLDEVVGQRWLRARTSEPEAEGGAA